MSRRIAFFDFDGTITTKDTMLEFFKFSKGKTRFYLSFALYSPVLVLFKLKLVPRQYVKQLMLGHLYRNTPLTEFQKLCDRFADEKIPALIRPKALKEIQKLRDAGAELVVVSASAENWVQKWCADNEIPLIATRMEILNDKISGKLNGINCHGDEKVRRIREKYQLENYDEIFCYGDTEGDKPMLALATFPFYKPFR